MTSPKVVIAAPAFNKAEYLPATLDSFIAQTFQDWALIVIDDASDDDTVAVAERYAARDERIVVVRNRGRRGMLENTRAAYELARQRFPQAPYWALGSDHDIWHDRWMERLVKVLESRPDVVMAYPRTQRISETGEVLRGPWTFDTYGVLDRTERFGLAFEGMVAGDMIYSLFRTEALDRVGTYRAVLVPDRLLLSELALHGQFKQVNEILWSRRFQGLALLSRQRKAFFPHGIPWHAYVPWWITHSAAFFCSYVVGGKGGDEIGRLEGLRLSLQYIARAGRRRMKRRYARRRKDMERALKERKRVLKRHYNRFRKRADPARVRSIAILVRAVESIPSPLSMATGSARSAPRITVAELRTLAGWPHRAHRLRRVAVKRRRRLSKRVRRELSAKRVHLRLRRARAWPVKSLRRRGAQVVRKALRRPRLRRFVILHVPDRARPRINRLLHTASLRTDSHQQASDRVEATRTR